MLQLSLVPQFNLVAACFSLALMLPGLGVDSAGAQQGELANLSVEQLLDLTVSSVARREETVAHSAAAVDVITQEHIRRSGALNVPDLLRLVPGLNVAQLSAHGWAISSRGFNEDFANKLLVLIDGRSVYTPLFSGVFWDVQDTLLEDIDRIEVIRGPGATLWGANAVNGVINIITKKSAETQGLLFSGGSGTEERAFGSVRYGGQISEQLHYRVFGKWNTRDSSALSDGSDAHDAGDIARGGFRIDWNAPSGSFVTLQGDLYSGQIEERTERLRAKHPFTPYEELGDYHVSGGNILGRWTHAFSASSEFVLQTYYDRSNRSTALVREERDTFDIDLQHRLALGKRQTLTLGGGYRVTADAIASTFELGFDPASRTSNLLSAFLQDEITLVEKRLTLTLGSKFEHNDYTGFEIQPSARLLWIPASRHSIWASVARAVRTPSRAEDDITLRQAPVYPQGALFPRAGPNLPPSPAAVTTVFGADDFRSEKLIAYEAGYRVQVSDRLSADLALFYNDYDELRSLEPNDPLVDFTQSPATIGVTGGNLLEGETYGGELSLDFQPVKWWRVRAGYAYLQMNLHRKDAGQDTVSEYGAERSSPRNQFVLRSFMDLPRGFEFDATLRYVDSLAAIQVDSYVALDLRLGWQVSKNVEVSIAGRNLLDARHVESRPTTIAGRATEVETSVFGKITIRF